MGYSVHKVNAHSLHREFPRTVDGVSLIYDHDGNRKYLTIGERRAFLRVAAERSHEVRSFCAVLAYTGGRLSEVLALTPARIDTAAGIVVIESLKKRRRGIFRGVPIPADLIAVLELTHDIEASRLSGQTPQPIWPWSRTTAWMRVKEVMTAASIVGPQASPKGLRHSFAVAALQSGVPLNFVRKWLGHARLSTTEIYADAIGEEEQAIAARFWKTF